MLRLLMLGLLLFTGAAGAAAGETISGVATAIDGDTLEIHGTRIRLFGIDAPESAQQCVAPDGKSWPCGRRVAFAVADAVKDKTVTCTVRDTDRYGRSVAVCYVGTQDLNEWIAKQGMAFAYTRYSREYADEEASARDKRIGIWNGTVQNPADFRRDKRKR